eukprot:2129210-Rhodomonas_salina.3
MCVRWRTAGYGRLGEGAGCAEAVLPLASRPEQGEDAPPELHRKHGAMCLLLRVQTVVLHILAIVFRIRYLMSGIEMHCAASRRTPIAVEGDQSRSETIRRRAPM